jgi:hypothetical protein
MRSNVEFWTLILKRRPARKTLTLSALPLRRTRLDHAPRRGDPAVDVVAERRVELRMLRVDPEIGEATSARCKIRYSARASATSRGDGVQSIGQRAPS